MEGMEYLTDPVQLAGIMGALIILVFFALNEWGALTTEDFWYDFGNAIGSTLLAVFAYATGSLPFLILNIVWALVSWRDVVTDILKR